MTSICLVPSVNWDFFLKKPPKVPKTFKISYDTYVNLFDSLLLHYRVVTFVQMTVHLTDQLVCILLGQNNDACACCFHLTLSFVTFHLQTAGEAICLPQLNMYIPPCMWMCWDRVPLTLHWYLQIYCYVMVNSSLHLALYPILIIFVGKVELYLTVFYAYLPSSCTYVSICRCTAFS